MRVAIYARVSTLDQDETLQLPALRDYAGRAGWEVIKEYTDKASAKDLDRPGWAALRSDAHRKEFDIILVTKLDRMIRSVRLLHSELIELAKFGVSVYTLSEGLLDVESPAGKLSLTILGGVAEWERDIISLRTREGIAARKARGESFGRPSAELPIHKIALCRLSGYTWVHIAHELGLNVSTIRNHRAEIEAEADKIRKEWQEVCS